MSCRFQSPGSLEMLLDTMCNTFGGIILIALLISLVARDARLEPRATPQGVSSSPALRLQEKEEELARQRAAVAALARADLGPASERVRMVQERATMRARLSSLAAEGARLKDQLAAEATDAALAMQELAVRLEQERVRLEREVPAEKSRQTELTRELEQLQSQAALVRERARGRNLAEVRRFRFPRERSTEKRPCDVIVRHGRLYPVHFFHEGMKERNTSTLRWQPAEADGEYVDPIPGLGLDPVRGRDAVEAFFRQVPATEYFLVFEVYEDSFGVFGLTKQMAVNRGFETGWAPLRAEQRLKAASDGQPRSPQ